jgi:hypothetical protein
VRIHSFRPPLSKGTVRQFRILRVALVVVWRNQFSSYSSHRAGTH